MVFFQPKLAIDDHEKARIEFQLQEIGEAIGFDSFRLPITRRSELLELESKTPQEIVEFIGSKLSHDTSGLELRIDIAPKEKCGGGG